ncbi:MAG: fibronectin type III domain-containing protein [Chloroflexota bacterium]
MKKCLALFVFAALLTAVLMWSQAAPARTAAELPAGAAAVDGGWSSWYWTPCSKECRDTEGWGRRQRIRLCNNPSPEDGGRECRRKDGSTTTAADRQEIDSSVGYGLGYIECGNPTTEITCSAAALEDDTPPTTPQNLQAGVLSDSKVRLQWDHASDNVEVIKYRLYDQRGFVIGVSEKSYYTPPDYQTNVYTISLLAPATTYAFSVSAVDEHGNESERTPAVTVTTLPYQHDADLLNPFTDIVYVGAFRLPGGSGTLEYGRWGYGGYGLAYYPQGDAGGPQDGYPGSLFGRGHVYDWAVSEISIPQAVISAEKDPADLPTATTLQPFARVDTFEHQDLTIPIGGMAYLPAQGSQTSDKLYYIWGNNYQWSKIPSHSASELTLDNPQAQGWWFVGPADGQPPYYSTAFYLFEIPQSWADRYTGGRRLLTGGTRSGAYNGFGTAMFAIGPWLDGNPPPFEAELSYRTLLEYGQVIGVDTQDGREVTDVFNGGAWITQAGKAAVMLVGNKTAGEVSYCAGYTPSLDWPVFLFYDPDELAAVTGGSKQPHEPQPYAMLDVSRYFFTEQPALRGVAYDRANGLVYVYEFNHEEPLIHVFRIAPVPGAPALNRPQCVVDGNTLTATLTWTPPAGTITSTLYYSGTRFGETDLSATRVLSDSLAASTTTYSTVLPYAAGDVAFFGLRSYLDGNTWSRLSTVVFCPHQDRFLPLVRK